MHLVPIRIYKADTLASDANAADAITYAWYFLGVAVINNSWRWPNTSTAITNAINNGVQQGRSGKGTTIIFAAGNTSQRSQGIYGGLEYPGYLSSVIAVGAIDRNGSPADYTPRGSELDIVALSGTYASTYLCGTVGDVVTTELAGSSGCNDGPDGAADYTEHFTGTSAAAPQVAAAAALLYADDPTLYEFQVRSRLLNYAENWGRSDDYGRGKLNVYQALRPPLAVEISGPQQVPADEQCDWVAVVSGGKEPYAYRWYKDGNLVGTDRIVTVPTGFTDFRLEAEVTDAASTIRANYLNVVVGGGTCDA